MRKGGLLVGMALGAGMVYFLDPQSGRLRRDRLRHRIQNRLGDRRAQDAPVEHGGVAAPVSRYGSRRGDIPGLEAATLTPTPGAGHANRMRALAGGALTLYGLARRGVVGGVARTVGAGMLWSEVREARQPPRQRRRERRRAVDIQTTLLVNAPVERVYDFWTDYDNFPLFMSNVRKVRDLGSGRSHWTIQGPGGVPIEWDSELTEQAPGSSLAWRSRPGSMLRNAGAVRFRREGGGTRVDLRLCYHPPAGHPGQAVAELMGADPRTALNQDLGRLKALLEETAGEGR